MEEHESTHIYERLSGLEERMKTVERTLEMSSHDVRLIRDDLKRELSRQSEELALTRQAARIFEDTVRNLDGQIRGMAAESKEIISMLHGHIVTDAGDKTKVLIGVITASGAGLASLGVLIWGVMQVIRQ